MVKDYQKGKIYRIFPINKQDENDEYIGSTCRDYLCQRWGHHNSGYKDYLIGKQKKCCSYDLFEKYGVENCRIELIENYPCKDVDELHRREGEIQRSRQCINKSVAGRTKSEYGKYYMSKPGNKERKMELQRIRRKKKD